jgi:hypothetical protein
VSIQGLEVVASKLTKQRVVSILLATLGVTAGACSSGFDSDKCETARTCVASPGDAADAGGAAGAPDASGAAGGADSAGAGNVEAAGAPPSCSVGLTACAGECVTLASDPDHCGACDDVCARGAICSSGKCVVCPAQRVACDQTCIDPATDSVYCGASDDCGEENRGATCGEGEICAGGACVSEDASLARLSLEPAILTPAFSPEQHSYEATFSYLVSHLSLAAEPTNAAASLSCAGQAFTADDTLPIVATPETDLASVSVDVTAESGKQQTYDVSLRRRALTSTYAKPFNTREGFMLGRSVAIDGDTAVFGAPSEDGREGGVDGDQTSTGRVDAGAAYVAVRTNGKWSRQAYLKAAVPEENDEFGVAVAISGETIAVGGNGTVWIFVRHGSSWAPQAELVEPGPEQSVSFGNTVAIEGDRLIVGAKTSGAISFYSGAVYSFTRSGTTWTAAAKHPMPPPEKMSGRDELGVALSLSADRVAVTSWTSYRTSFMMLRSGTEWIVEDEILPPTTPSETRAVALDGDWLAMSGADVVYVFTRSGSSWPKTAALSPFDAAATEGFGASLSMKDGLLAVGSACDTCKGGVSTFARRGDSWVDGAFVTAKDADVGATLGASVAISGGLLVVGAPGEDSDARSFNQTGTGTAIDSGAAFLFE